VDTDEVHDLALLKIDQGFLPLDHYSTPIFSIARPAEGTQVAISGYPLNKKVMQTTSGAIASSWDYETVVEPRPDRPQTKEPKIEDYFDVDVHLNPGNSGGPVYLPDNGEVIGVAQAYNTAYVMVVSGDVPTPAKDKESGQPLLGNSGLKVPRPAYGLSSLRRARLSAPYR